MMGGFANTDCQICANAAESLFCMLPHSKKIYKNRHNNRLLCLSLFAGKRCFFGQFRSKIKFCMGADLFHLGA